jgi:hypothetical protein
MPDMPGLGMESSIMRLEGKARCLHFAKQAFLATFGTGSGTLLLDTRILCFEIRGFGKVDPVTEPFSLRQVFTAC